MSSSNPLVDLDEQEAESFKSRYLGRLTKDILKHVWPFWGGLAMAVLGTFASLLEPRIFGYAIDEVIVPVFTDASEKKKLLLQFSLIFLGVMSVRVVAMISQAYLFEVLGQRVTENLRNRLFTRLQSLPISTFDKNPAGRLLMRVTNDTSALADMFSSGFVSMFANILMVIGIVTWLFVLDWKLASIAVAVLIPLALASSYFSKRLQVSYRESRTRLSSLNSFLAENLMGIRQIFLFNRQKLHLERFERIAEWYTQAQIGTVKVFAFLQPLITIAAGTAMAWIIYAGGESVRQRELPIGVLITFFAFVMALFQPMREIADKWNVFLSGMASAERIYSILDWQSEMPTRELKDRVSKRKSYPGNIRFENVWFAYEAENWVLKDLNLEIPAGSKIGIVGQTGSGKTTLISLLLRFYEIQKGRILLDGQDIREINKRELRKIFGVVQQDVFLFSGSAYENLTFWGDLPDAGVKRHFPEFEETSYQKNFYERGTNLSMGQKQLIAFGRAFASQPDIWILDEATANMDSESEIQLQARLKLAAEGKTWISIAHRLATIREADRIFVLHKGRLIEQGNHQELVKLDGLYARLDRYQRAMNESEVAREMR